MAINIINNHINKFNEILEQVCTLSAPNTYQLNKEFGSGEFKRYENDNWNLYIGHFKITQDLRLQRFPDSENPGQYSISFQSFNEHLDDVNWNNPDIKKASEGVVFYSNESTLNSIWHKNTQCSMIYLSFNLDWISHLEKVFNFPHVTGQMIRERKNPMFHIPLSTDMKLNLKQMLYLPSEVGSDFINAYLYSKSVELFTQAAGSVTQRVNSQTKKHTIHPEDLNTLEQVKIQLINNYQEPPTVQDLVDETGVSKSKLQRLFNAVYDSSIYQFIKNVRMEKSMELLMQGYSVTEAAYDVGYSSIPNFSSAFKDYYNQSPGQITNR